MAVVTIDEIDLALYNRFGGTVTGNRHIASNITVNGQNPAIFVGQWAPTYDPSSQSRDFPAISIYMTDYAPDMDRLDGRLQVTVSEDNLASPPTRSVSEAPQPYVFSYAVCTWSRKPLEDKQLLTQLLATTLIQDTLVIDSERDLYMLRDRSPARIQENVDDQVSYRNMLYLSIFAEIQSSTIHTYKKIVEARVDGFDGVATPQIDRTLVITENGVTIS